MPGDNFRCQITSSWYIRVQKWPNVANLGTFNDWHGHGHKVQRRRSWNKMGRRSWGRQAATLTTPYSTCLSLSPKAVSSEERLPRKFLTPQHFVSDIFLCWPFYTVPEMFKWLTWLFYSLWIISSNKPDPSQKSAFQNAYMISDHWSPPSSSRLCVWRRKSVKKCWEASFRSISTILGKPDQPVVL